MQTDTINVAARPLRKPGDPPMRDPDGFVWIGPAACDARDLVSGALAKRYPNHVILVLGEAMRRDVYLSLPHIGLRRLAAPEPSPHIRYGEPGAPKKSPSDWQMVLDIGEDPTELAAYLGHLTPRTRMRAAAAVAHLALQPLAGDLRQNLATALDAVDAYLAGMPVEETLRLVESQLGALLNDDERRTPAFEEHAMRAVRRAVQVSTSGWNLWLQHAASVSFCDVVESTWNALDTAPEYAARRTARMAAMLDREAHIVEPHPEIAAVIRDVIGDEGYTALPTLPVVEAPRSE